jgi:hypothetical protein
MVNTSLFLQHAQLRFGFHLYFLKINFSFWQEGEELVHILPKQTRLIPFMYEWRSD